MRKRYEFHAFQRWHRRSVQSRLVFIDFPICLVCFAIDGILSKICRILLEYSTFTSKCYVEKTNDFCAETSPEYIALYEYMGVDALSCRVSADKNRGLVNFYVHMM